MGYTTVARSFINQTFGRKRVCFLHFREAKHLLLDEFVARHQIAQLVSAPQLNLATVYLVQVVEVISLEDLIGELSQAHPVGAPQPGLDAVAAEHRAHPKVPSGLRQELHHAPVLVPAQIVQHSHGTQFCGAVVEAQFVVGEDPLQAFADAAGVLLHRVSGQTLPLGRFPTRVSDLRRGPPDHGEDVVSSLTEVQQSD